MSGEDSTSILIPMLKGCGLKWACNFGAYTLVDYAREDEDKFLDKLFKNDCKLLNSQTYQPSLMFYHISITE